MNTNVAELILENGERFKGQAFGDVHDTVGEAIFTTAMTGYQEAITDPSFAGQIVVMTYPLIGNYGINLEDNESEKPALKAIVVREKCDYPNNFRTEMTLDGFLKQEGVLGLEGIDTRALTKTLRTKGVMRGIIVCGGKELSDSEIKERIESLDNSKVVSEVTTKEKYLIKGSGKNVAFIDLGAKRGILENLKKRNCNIHVFPASVTADEIFDVEPDLVFISNGPGDPLDIPEVTETVKKLIGRVKVCGICMGHLIIGLALGGKTEKLKFGHHGENHPVKDLKTNKIYISAQNHNYVVSDLPEDVEPWFINVNDNTLEGLRHKTLPVQSVQFHPEASGGPLDSGYIFDEFLK